MNLKYTQPPIESQSKLGCDRANMIALLYSLSNQRQYATGTSDPIVQVADVILEHTLCLSNFKVCNYKRELKELGILDYQIRKGLPTLYRLNLEVMRSEYGYDCFDSNYSDVPSAPKEKVAAVTTENKKSKYSKNGYNKKQTSDNSKNNISYSNSYYVFKKPYENVQEKRDKLLEDIKNN